MKGQNDDDVFLLIDLALEMGKGIASQLFINKHHLEHSGSIPSVNTSNILVRRHIRLNVSNAQGQLSGLNISHDDSNSVIVPLFDSELDVVPSDREMELPLSYFQHSGGNGYIDFEGQHRSAMNHWSFSDELKKGMRWDTKEQLVHAVKMHHVISHRDFKVVKSNTSTWCVKCVNDDTGCKWRLCACKKKGDDAFEISIVEGPHTCVNPLMSNDHSQLDANLLAKSIDKQVRETPDVAVNQVRSVVGDKFGYDVTWRRAYNAKKKAIANVYGDWDESYNLLLHLLNAIKEENEDTMVEWVYSPVIENQVVVFERVFWSFGPCIKAFEHLRPVISVDGTFLYGKYKHKLLIACGMDVANHIVPLAFALVDEESRKSWSWFLICLKRYVVQNVVGPICLISDRRGGIRVGVDDVDVGWRPPFAYWRFCIRHVISNYNVVVKNKYCKEGAMTAAMQAQPSKCMKLMDIVSKRQDNALHYLNEIPLDQWTLAHDGGYRFGYMTTNLNESYNVILKGARKLPVASLVKKTFYNCVGYFKARRAEANEAIMRGDQYTRFCDDMFSRWVAASSVHSVTMFSYQNGVFDITTVFRNTSSGFKGGNRHIVGVKVQKCTCNKWQIYRIPCSHACAAFASANVDVAPHIGPWYSWMHQLLVYEGQFKPYIVEAYWNEVNVPRIIPDPGRIRSNGRPRSTRIHNEMDSRESNTKYSCSICKRNGHNKRKCPAYLQNECSSSRVW